MGGRKRNGAAVIPARISRIIHAAPFTKCLRENVGRLTGCVLCGVFILSFKSNRALAYTYGTVAALLLLLSALVICLGGANILAGRARGRIFYYCSSGCTGHDMSRHEVIIVISRLRSSSVCLYSVIININVRPECVRGHKSTR